MSKTPVKHEFSVKPGSVVLVLFIALVAFGLWQIRGIILVILTAVVLATFVNSGVAAFKKIRIPRMFSVPIMFLIGIGILVGIMYFFVPIFLDELVGLAELLPAGSDVTNVLGAFGNEELRTLVTSGNADPFVVMNALREQFSTSDVVQSMSQLFGGVVNVLLVLVISFYLAMQKNGVEQFLRIVTPLQYEEYVISIWFRSRVKIASWFKGQVFLALINAVLTYIGLLAIGVPYAFMLSLIALILSLIPFGIVIATIPAVMLAFLSGGLPMALITLALYTVLQQIENNVTQPLIIRRVTGVPSLVVLLSVVIGAKLAGLPGLILAIPVAVVVLELINDAEAKRIGKLDNMPVSE